MLSNYNKPYNTVYFSGWQDLLADKDFAGTAWRKWTDNSEFLNDKKPTHIGPWWIALSPSTTNRLDGEETLTASAYKNLLSPWLTLDNKSEDIFWRIKQYEAKFTIAGKAQKKWLTKESVNFTGEEFEKEKSYLAVWDGPDGEMRETIKIKVTSSINSIKDITETCFKNSLRDDGYHQEFYGLTNNSIEVISGNANAEILTIYGPDTNSYILFGPITESTLCNWGVLIKITHLSTIDGYVGDSQFAGNELYDIIPFEDKKIIESLDPFVVDSQIDKTYRVPYYRLIASPTSFVTEVAQSPEILDKDGITYDVYPVEFVSQFEDNGSIINEEDWENRDTQVWPDTPTFIKMGFYQGSPRDTIKVCAIHNGKWQVFNQSNGTWELKNTPEPFSFTPPLRSPTFFPNEKELVFYGAKLSPWIEPIRILNDSYDCSSFGLANEIFTMNLTTVPSEASYLVGGYWDQTFVGTFQMPDETEESINVYLSIDKVISGEALDVIRVYAIAHDSELPKITEFSIKPKKWFEFRNQDGLPVFDELTGEKINDLIKNPS